MAWTSADFRSYPSAFPTTLRRAVRLSPEPVLFGAYSSPAEAQSLAVQFRKYRFLIRSHPGVDSALDQLLSSYHIRTKIEAQPFRVYALWVTAKPTLTSDLEALNPELRDILTSSCQ